MSVTISQPVDDILNSEIPDTFHTISGWGLEPSVAAGAVDRPVAETVFPVAKTGNRLEINAAYTLIKSILAGSTLYRTSLKGDEIMLSFISQQVEERYEEKIAVLQEQTGWALSINPQPNQGGILEIARAILNKAGLVIAKGPSIYLEKADVTLSLAVDPGDIAPLVETFIVQTGYQLIVHWTKSNSVELSVGTPDKTVAKSDSENIVEIPFSCISLNNYYQSHQRDPAKLEKAIQRARSNGIDPPIQVRRMWDGYILTDGLYRLRALETLGVERIPAAVE